MPTPATFAMPARIVKSDVARQIAYGTLSPRRCAAFAIRPPSTGLDY